jgi:hypothetical protein
VSFRIVRDDPPGMDRPAELAAHGALCLSSAVRHPRAPRDLALERAGLAALRAVDVYLAELRRALGTQA